MITCWSVLVPGIMLSPRLISGAMELCLPVSLPAAMNRLFIVLPDALNCIPNAKNRVLTVQPQLPLMP
jgi:hypothetical protein